MTDTLATTEKIDPETGEPLIAHIVKKGDDARGYVFGDPIQALCGKTFVPHRDPVGLPVCEACKIEKARLMSSGSN